MNTDQSLQLPPDQTVRKADTDESAAVGRILGSAFSHDPVFNWVAGGPGLATPLFTAEARLLYGHHNHVYINASCTGAAMWLPPGVSHGLPSGLGTVALLLRMLVSMGFGGLRRGQQLEHAMSRNFPRQPHYYLHAIGAHMDHQGRGIGSALLKSGLADVDAARMPAYLESSNARNNPLYERFGFEVTGEHTMPGDGPTVWFMWRAAR